MLPDLTFHRVSYPRSRPRQEWHPRLDRLYPCAVTETWLTQDLYDKLQAELADLSGPVREEIKRRIAAAREEGDLKENGGYHAAREEQGKLEGRIRQLEDMLRRAEVGETPRTTASSSPA